MFNSKEFQEAWDEWKSHKYEKDRFPYTAVSERKALSALYQKSCGNEALAIDSINYSIEKNWNNVYIKPNENGNSKNNGITNKNGGQLSSTAIIRPDKTFDTSL